MDAWGKFDQGTGRFHRLEHHCADVAACFEALLREPVLRARFARAAGTTALDPTTAARLTYLAYLHAGEGAATTERDRAPATCPTKR